jgi:hypothetical protein
MVAFLPELHSALEQQIEKYQTFASQHEWILIESDLQRPTLYSGTDSEQLMKIVRSWTPGQGVHQPFAALEVGRELAGRHGIVLYLSDHLGKLPEGVDLLAVGRKLENVGFAGLVVDTADGRVHWKVVVKNYGESSQKREWWVEAGGKSLPAEVLELPAKRATVLKGEIPEGVDRIALRLSRDTFELDNIVPILFPQEKSLRVRVDVANNRAAGLFGRAVGSSPIAEEVGPDEISDLVVLEGGDGSKSLPSVVFGAMQAVPSSGKRRAVPVAENHSILRDLNWKGLLAVISPVPVRSDIYEPLVWQGEVPLISLREGSVPSLVFHFHPNQSNALKNPSFALLLNRFFHLVHRRVPLTDPTIIRRNLEFRQKTILPFAVGSSGLSLHQGAVSMPLSSLPGAHTMELSSPAMPGFFSVQQGEKLLFEGAVRFADVLEADFSLARSVLREESHDQDILVRNSYRDPLEGIWMLLLALLSLLTWGWRAGGIR